MDSYDVIEYYFEIKDELTWHIINEWHEKKHNSEARQSWKVIPSALLINEWRYNARTGLTRDKNIKKIEKIIIENSIKLKINTELFGHTPHDSFNLFLDYLPEEITTKDEFYEYFEKFEWFACDEFGSWRISDSANDQIDPLLFELIAEENCDKKLYWIDRILNICHPRSDLSSWFVEDGWQTLDQIAGK